MGVTVSTTDSTPSASRGKSGMTGDRPASPTGAYNGLQFVVCFLDGNYNRLHTPAVSSTGTCNSVQHPALLSPGNDNAFEHPL